MDDEKRRPKNFADMLDDPHPCNESQPSDTNPLDGRALICVHFGKPAFLIFEGHPELIDLFADCGSFDGFDSIDTEVPTAGGVYIAELGWADDGPGDSPWAREIAPQVKNWRPATEAEWDSHLIGEWPWESKSYWRTR